MSTQDKGKIVFALLVCVVAVVGALMYWSRRRTLDQIDGWCPVLPGPTEYLCSAGSLGAVVVLGAIQWLGLTRTASEPSEYWSFVAITLVFACGGTIGTVLSFLQQPRWNNTHVEWRPLGFGKTHRIQYEHFRRLSHGFFSGWSWAWPSAGAPLIIMHSSYGSRPVLERIEAAILQSSGSDQPLS